MSRPLTRDEARKSIIAACFQDASGKTNFIEHGIATIENDVRLETLRRVLAMIEQSDGDLDFLKFRIEKELCDSEN